ncbi:MAG: hypothetical protein ACXADF_05730 [Candidatus Thorarchaeota archaeon]
MQKVKDGARKKIADSFTGQYEDDEYDSDIVVHDRRIRRKKRKPRFTSAEIKDLGIATVLTILVSIAIFGLNNPVSPIAVVNGFLLLPVFLLSSFWWFPIAVILIFWLSFMIHEFAHKFTAQRYGMYAHFKMVVQGYYLSAIAILFAIPIFGTGVMQVGGARDLEDYAKSTVAGPLSNFIVAVSLIIIAEVVVFTTGGLVYAQFFVIYYGVILNSFLGLFNMIPLPIFDGGTVLRWNKPVWAILTIALVSTLLIGYFVLPAL